jgi:hypothetical protein
MIVAQTQPAPLPAAALGRSTTAVITGTVEDQSGAVIPAAELLLISPANGQSSKTLSDNSGRFAFEDVLPGHYLVRVKAEEMQSTEADVVVSHPRVDITLRMKVMVEEEVRVSAADPDPVAPDRNSNAVDLSDAVLQGLPTDSQNIVPLLTNFAAPAAGGTEGISLVVDGMEADQIEDLPASAIKQVIIDRNPYAAEFRRPGNARIEITTKNGSPKHYHGQVGIFARDSVFDATNALATQKPNLSRKLYEGTFGGPLGVPTAAFFVSAQHLDNKQDTIVNAAVLDAAGEPAALLQNVPTGTTRNNYLARLDFHPGNVHTLTGFYGFDELFQTNQGVAGFNLQDDGYSTSLRGHKFQLMDQAVASPTMLNTARVLFRGGSSRSGQPPTAYAIDVNGSFSSGPSQTSQHQQESLWEFEDIAAHARKNHTFRFGGSTRSRRFAAS